MDELSTESDLSELRELAVEVFDSKERAELWLTQHHNFYKLTPIMFAQTKNGLQEIKRILYAIATGGTV